MKWTAAASRLEKKNAFTSHLITMSVMSTQSSDYGILPLAMENIDCKSVGVPILT
jgi:hypothetical protein